MEVNRLFGLSNRRTAAKFSNAVRTVQKRPLSFLSALLLALGFYLLGTLHGGTNKVHISYGASYLRTNCPDVGRCPPCDIPEGLKALIPPLATKHEEILKSTAIRWLAPWDKYDFEESSISIQMVDKLWNYTIGQGHSHSAFRVRVINGSFDWPPILMQTAGTQNIYYMPRVNLWYSLFSQLSDTYGLPDYLDMVISTQDHPLMYKTPVNMDKAPLFGYTTTAEHADIPIPTMEHFGKIDLSPQEIEGARKWEGRTAKAIWRGSPAGGEYRIDNFWKFPRTHLVNQTRAHPDILDAKFLPCAPGECSGETFQAMQAAGLPTDMRQLFFGDYTGYKYLIDIDGNAWSSGYAHVLATGAVLFKAETPFKEYFYDFLTPYKDYIPIARDASDLPEKLRYAVDHDYEMQLIHRRVLEKHNKFIGNGTWLKYVHLLLTEYSSLLERPKDLSDPSLLQKGS